VWTAQIAVTLFALAAGIMPAGGWRIARRTCGGFTWPFWPLPDTWC